VFGEVTGLSGTVLAGRHTAQRALRNPVHAFQGELRHFREILLKSNLPGPRAEDAKVTDAFRSMRDAHVLRSVVLVAGRRI